MVCMSVFSLFFFFLMIRRPPRSTLDRSSAASDVYKRQDTAWAQDDDSVTQFGTFERRINATQAMTATEAEALRYTALTRYLAPGKVLRTGETGQGATLRAVGYWQRMRRIYYSQPAGLIEHTDGTSSWPIGEKRTHPSSRSS